MLLMEALREELSTARSALINLLQNLGFLVNVKKSVLNPALTLEFLGILVNFQDMTLSLLTEKMRKTQKHSKEILNQP